MRFYFRHICFHVCRNKNTFFFFSIYVTGRDSRGYLTSSLTSEKGLLCLKIRENAIIFTSHHLDKSSTSGDDKHQQMYFWWILRDRILWARRIQTPASRYCWNFLNYHFQFCRRLSQNWKYKRINEQTQPLLIRIKSLNGKLRIFA